MSDRPDSDKPTDPSPSVDTTVQEDQPFLQRWSRRKLAADQPPAPIAPAAEQQPPPVDPGDEDMPPLESLDEHADYSGFFSPKVSAELRRAALRKLFRAPRFNITDGLDDYAEDFRSYQALGEVITHEMRRMLDREAQRLKAQATEDPTEDTPAEDDTQNQQQIAHQQPTSPTDQDSEPPEEDA